MATILFFPSNFRLPLGLPHPTLLGQSFLGIPQKLDRD
jgi:hypothetical protein